MRRGSEIARSQKQRMCGGRVVQECGTTALCNTLSTSPCLLPDRRSSEKSLGLSDCTLSSRFPFSAQWALTSTSPHACGMQQDLLDADARLRCINWHVSCDAPALDKGTLDAQECLRHMDKCAV
ncbi:hypothetical protein SCP_0702380 [Sparassis crispa]|uniref:Uncharacterized protein n=1 Tax=Sparassis crispa TaxID=139825 RepID=A0A401GS38_9APHY|nr:hypothetical protein SCP_0702380 [Sparassis crispa]GBE85052.1 hypothetical protein SCP_0702380 [Sparassis crispa]